MEQVEKLHILWTNADPITSEKMVMMYATNAMLRSWWDEVTVIIWGATAKLVAEDEAIREKVRIACEAGVRFTACKGCSDQLGVSGNLDLMGIEVKYWGDGLTRLIKDKENLITV